VLKRRALGAVAMLATSLLLIGCGKQALSDRELVKQATRICQLAGMQTSEIPAPTAPEGSAAYLKHGIAVMGPELVQLRKLRPSDDFTSVYAVSVNSFATKLGYLRDTVRDLAHGEDPVIAMSVLQQDLAPIERQEDAAWKTLQVSACLNL
jgi:hypothetical protein